METIRAAVISPSPLSQDLAQAAGEDEQHGQPQAQLPNHSEVRQLTPPSQQCTIPASKRSCLLLFVQMEDAHVLQEARQATALLHRRHTQTHLAVHQRGGAAVGLHQILAQKVLH